MGKFDGMMLLTDMDGTFLNSRKEISDKNAEAAEYFMAEGGKFSVATGRSRKTMEYFMPKLKINAPAVLCNGAVIYDFEKEKTVALRELEHAQAVAFAQDILERFPQTGLEIFLEEEAFVAHTSAITRRHFASVKLPYREASLKEIKTPWITMNWTAEHEELLRVAEYCRERYGDRYFMQFSAPYFYEVMRKGADKGAGAQISRDYCGIRPENLYTVGDNFNDQELLDCAALSFAPANAVEKVKESVDVLLPHCDDDAIAAAVDYLAAMKKRDEGKNRRSAMRNSLG